MAETTTPEVTLWVDGKIHSGWLSTSVALNLDHLSGSFDLTVSEGWLEAGRLVSNRIRAGAACTVKIDGTSVITGYVDAVTPRFDAGQHQIAVRGRDKAGDLVDCSAVVKEYLGQRLEAVAAALCAPFGITVRVQGDTGRPFSRVAVNAGDSVAEVLERMCRQRGVLAWSDGLGGLIVGRPGADAPVATLVRGTAAGNILAADADDDRSQRFSEVTVLGSREGADELGGDDINHMKGTARDAAITRHRPLIVIPEAHGGEAPDMGGRAAWEVRVRAAKGRRANVQVQGWTHGGGVYRPGQTVAIEDEWLGLSGSRLIANAAFSRDDAGGTVTSLTLYPPAAFDLFAQPGEED